ncbi:hypothetical protein ACFE04_002889 [Oxalis oulophora]
MVGSNDNSKINCSSSEKPKEEAWGIREEMLLGFAVKRHGLNNWNSVSMELLKVDEFNPALATPTQCKGKFKELSIKFQHLVSTNHDHIPPAWLEELKRLRIDELKGNIQRSDLNVRKLEAKLKKLKDEKEEEKEKEKEKKEKEKKDMEKPGTDNKERQGTGDGENGLQSEALVGLLETIEAHKNISFFQHRISRQKCRGYKLLIRQHMDIETIKSKLQNGSYSSSPPAAFYKDMLLVFTNGLVFFPKNSVEYVAAGELRTLVLNAIRRDLETRRSSVTAAGKNIKEEAINVTAANQKKNNSKKGKMSNKKKSIAGFLERINDSVSPVKPSKETTGKKVVDDSNKREKMNRTGISSRKGLLVVKEEIVETDVEQDGRGDYTGGGRSEKGKENTSVAKKSNADTTKKKKKRKEESKGDSQRKAGDDKLAEGKKKKKKQQKKN